MMARKLRRDQHLQFEPMERRLVLTAATAVDLAAPPPAKVEVAFEAAPDNSTSDDTTTSLARGVDQADFNADGVIDAVDIDMLSAAINSGEFDALYDLSEDSVLDHRDMDSMVHEWLETEYGDANLDRAIDGADLMIWRANAFQPGGWAAGDFTGDSYVDGYDFLVWNYSKSVLTISSNPSDDGASAGSEEVVDESTDETAETTDATDQTVEQPVIAGDTLATSASDDAEEETDRDDDFLSLQ